MGTETLPDNTTVAAGLFIKSADFLTTNAALKGDFVGRNASGVPTSGQNNGNALYPWGNVVANAITINGQTIDTSQIVTPANRIISGKTRTTSGQPQFLQANGAAASVQVLGATTNLILSIDSASVTVSTDITKASLSTAPATNNTCTINNVNFVDQAESKYFGEPDSDYPVINIDAVGTEISARVGQFITLKTSVSEYMFGWLKSATEFVSVKRGFFFDSSVAAIVRETLADNDTLTLMETGWIFIDEDALTVDVTYLTPVYAYTAPSAPAASQYWRDLENVTWKRWSGSAWVEVAREPIGLCVINTSNCVATRSFDFYGSFTDENTIDCNVFSDEVVRSVGTYNTVNVYGTVLTFHDYPVQWNNTADMETGAVTTNATYYLYLTTSGQPKVSLERPYDRTGDLRGKYHPYNNWRYICDAVTDDSSDWLQVLGSAVFDNQPTKANFDAEDLKIGETTGVATSSLSFKKLELRDNYGRTKTLYNKSYLYDMAVHIQGAELASTWYDKWIDFDQNLKLVPNLTGTADSDVANSLSASAALFQTYGVHRWAEIYNTTDNTKGYVKAVSSETVVTCMDRNGIDLDLFPDGNETFMIRILQPVGLGAFKERVGAVYNNASPNIDDSFYTQIQEEKEYLGDGSDFTITGTAGYATVSAYIRIKQVNDWTGSGNWKSELTCQCTFTASSSPDLAVGGILYRSLESGSVAPGVNGYSLAQTSPGTGNIQVRLGAGSTSMAVFMSAMLDKKPTFHI